MGEVTNPAWLDERGSLAHVVRSVQVENKKGEHYLSLHLSLQP